MGDRQGQRELLEQLLLERYESVAVVGIGLRFPGANTTPAGFADFLRAGRSGITPIPAERWDVPAWTAAGPDELGKIWCAGGGFVDGVDEFDPRFFNISPKEAAYIDPQQRLALETAWEALEHAAIDPTPLRGGDGGVYMAVSNFDYAAEIGALPPPELNGYAGTGTAHSASAGRLSYFLGWRGPSIHVDTACSASLVALHLAVQGLRNRECDIALCGAANTIHNPRGHILATHSNMLAPDGRCKTFDDEADGYCRSEGCGVIVLKRVSDALRDGDRLLGLVRGTSVRQDGESSALMVPNGTAQEALMRVAIANAALEPGDISYVEAHGTGTALGDPIEMGAISAVFGRSHTRDNPIVVGSAKTNLGHMESAAGMGGIIKTLLQLQEGAFYPHLNLVNPSRHIPWDSVPVRVPTEGGPWPGEPRRALVNSFGFAGTIAAAVLEQPPPVPQPPPAEGPYVFALSARSESSRQALIGRYKRFLDEHPDLPIGDLCYTAATGRAHLPVRLAGPVRDRDELLALLDRKPPAPPSGPPRRVAFLFTGGGSQYVGMGAPLYARFPEFRRHLDELDELFAPHLSRSLRAMVLGEADDAELIHQIRWMQPALFSLDYAVAMLWRSWGVTPHALLGHSVGELVAATVAGALPVEDAVRVVAARGRLMESAPRGAMMAVETGERDVRPLLTPYDDLSLAAVNGPGQCVVSGGNDSLDAVGKALEQQGIKVKRLAISCASHSPLMAGVLEEFREVLSGVRFREPELTVVSNLSGELADPAELTTPDYWVRHLAEPVNFAAGMAAIERQGPYAFVEVGPSTELIGMGKQCVNARDHRWLSSLHPDDGDAAVIGAAAAQLYQAGVPLSWAGFHRGRPGRRITAPTYAFDNKRYWLTSNEPAPASSTEHPLLGRELDSDEPGAREFGTELTANRPGYLADHVVLGRVVFPGAGYLEILFALQDAVYGETSRPMTDVRIYEAMFLTDEPVRVRTRLRERPDGGAEVEIVSQLDGRDGVLERRHVSAVIEAAHAPDSELTALAAELSTVGSEPIEAELAGEDIYDDFADAGVEYGPSFRHLRGVVRHGTDLAVSELAGLHETGLTSLPPQIMDSALQTVAGLSIGDDFAMPVVLGRCQLLKRPRGGDLRCVLRRRPDEPPVADSPSDMPPVDLLVLDGDRVVFALRGLGLKRVVGVAAENRRKLLAVPRWTKRSLRATAARPAHALLVGPADGTLPRLAERAASAGVTLSHARDVDEAIARLADRPTDLCWYWPSGGPGPRHAGDGGAGPVDAAGLRAECEGNYRELLRLVQGLDQARFGRDQRLWLLTEGAQWLPGDLGGDGERLAAATLWGFGHTMWTEYPAYRVTLVDLPEGGLDCPDLVDEWLAGETAEYQVAYRDGHRHVRRLTPWPPAGQASASGQGGFELAIEEYGQFEGVRQVPVEEVAPTGDQIRVRVRAAGLNLKDVLNSLGLHREFAERPGAGYEPLPLGLECAGTVEAVGPDATHAVGDEVAVAHLGSLRSTITTSSARAWPKPARLSFAEAAALPTAYLTAYHALHDLADLKPGERVLIHAAAGGVGQAAVALAMRAGAEVYATASPAKWPLLHAQGVTRVLNSRTLEFADAILAETGGAGVHVVLNSLNKEFIPAGMRVLAPGGRFVELGRMGAWSAEEAGEHRPDVAYHTFDFSEFDPDDITTLGQRVLGPVIADVADGSLRALPTTAYSLDEVAEAFGALSRGTNRGKVVIEFPAPAAEPSGGEPEEPIRPDETYLITGGLGALGQVAAVKLADLGARHIAVVGRSPAVAAEKALRARLGAGVELTVLTGDVANAADVDQVMAELALLPHPLGGVIHAAGVLADRPVATMTWEHIDAVFGPKVFGTWLLSEATRDVPELRFFINYSSVAVLVGSRGQANYAAANAFLDALTHWRHAQGLPGTSLNWGAWGGVGLAAGMNEAHIKSVEEQGVTFFRPATGARAMASLLDGAPAQIVVAEVDWNRYAATRPIPNALYADVAKVRETAGPDLDLAGLAGRSKADRVAALVTFIRASVADLLHFDGADDVPADARFFEVGMDSLVAVELKNRLEVALRIPLAATVVFDHPAVGVLAEFVDGQLSTEAAP